MSEGNGKIEQQVQQLVTAARAEGRAEAAREWQEKMATFASEFVQRAATMVPAPIAAPSIPSIPGMAAKPLSPGKLLHPHCDYPGCDKPHCGPKYRWMCRDHRKDWKVARKMHRQAERQAAQHAA
jgi:hypothetical protein